MLDTENPAATERPEAVWGLLSRWLAPHEADLEQHVVYTFHSAIARAWRNGRLLLAGDAAHLTPPFLGQGMCAGIRDVANLAWKLERVVRGLAPDTLLDSYQLAAAHPLEAFVDPLKRQDIACQVADGDAAIHLPTDDAGHVCSAGGAAERAAHSGEAGHQLERARRDLAPALATAASAT